MLYFKKVNFVFLLSRLQLIKAGEPRGILAFIKRKTCSLLKKKDTNLSSEATAETSLGTMLSESSDSGGGTELPIKIPLESTAAIIPEDISSETTLAPSETVLVPKSKPKTKRNKATKSN